MTHSAKSLRARCAIVTTLFLSAVGQPAAAQGVVSAGPMAGYASLREAALWVQLKAPARVRFVYWDSAAPGTRYTTAEQEATAANVYVIHALADSVREDRRYFYELQVNGRTVPVGRPLGFRTPPRESGAFGVRDIRIAFGTCSNIADPRVDVPGNVYGAGYEIFEAIADQRPDFMLWGGDNLYFRDADWSSRTGMRQRYTHDRALPELQRLLGVTNHYAVWDDHDYGPNDVDRSWSGKLRARETFQLFWANPGYGVPGAEESIGTSYRWGDVEVFLMDDRSYRASNNMRAGDGDYWGQGQLRWLIGALKSSSATFKLVTNGGQVLSPLTNHENMANYGRERGELLAALAQEPIDGVMFLSGDRHLTELTKMPRLGLYPLYDATISPLTSKPFGDPEEPNPWRVRGTWTTVRNFAMLEVTGPRGDRVLTITVRDQKAKVLWTHAIRHKELRGNGEP